MIYSLRGQLLEKHPTYIVLETHGVAYQIFISLFTYGHLQEGQEMRILTHQIIKEDGHFLYGFSSENERQLFVFLISVNGVGPNTARLILSSLEPEAVRQAIATRDELVFRKIKGVGPKTAQRILIDLYDKVFKEPAGDMGASPVSSSQSLKNEALSALIALGFAKASVEQAFKVMPEANEPGISVEQLIKAALKKLA